MFLSKIDFVKLVDISGYLYDCETLEVQQQISKRLDDLVDKIFEENQTTDHHFEEEQAFDELIEDAEGELFTRDVFTNQK